MSTTRPTEPAASPDSGPQAARPWAPAARKGFWQQGVGRWLVLVVLVAAAIALGWTLTHQAPTVQYQTTPVDRGTISSKVTASGTLSALTTVQVGSQVSGRLLQIMVDYNSPVHKGQALAKLDPQLFQAALEQARANYTSAGASLEKARTQAADADIQLSRTRLLAKQGFVPASELDTARTTADVAHAQVTVAASSLAQASAALHQAQINLTYTSILSPINGVVISRNVDVGQTVAASLQAPTLFVLAEDLRKLQVDTSVSEADVSRLHAGMPADFTVDAYPNETFHGRVRQIRNAPQTVQNVVTYDAVLDVANPALKLKPGMTANVSFVEAQHDNVLRVPNAALRYTPSSLPERRNHRQGGRNRGQAGEGAKANAGANGQKRDWATRKRVWVLDDNKPRPVRVQTGLTDGSFTEITGGELHEGDGVITDETGAGQGAGGGNASSFRRMGRMF